jgi:RNA polymerase sigma-70 factor (ECF subfamily)
VTAPFRSRRAPAAHAAGDAAPGDAAPGDAADLYRQLAPAVLGYLRAERAADPEDLLGEVFLQVVRDLPRFRGDADACRRWVFTIARNRLIDDRRRAARRPATAPGRQPGEPPAPPPPGDLDPALLDALRRLTDDQREVVVLRFVADLPIDAVARLTGRSPGAVKALQHRALIALAGLLQAPAAAG